MIIIVWGLYSCSSNDEGIFVHTLTSPNSCWVFYNYPKEQMGNGNVTIGGCNKFYDDYTFVPFVLKEGTATEIHSLDKNISNRGVWKFDADDSTFSVEGQVFKMLSFSADTITLMSEKNHLQKMLKTYLTKGK